MSEELNVAESVGGATEVVFSFDTTGSMRPCIAAVRDKIEQTCEELFDTIEGLKVGMIAHGDYCDGDRVITKLPLTDDPTAIINFIRNTPNTGGGDAPECYELALHEARDMGWSEDAKSGRAVVMIGDADPHPPSYPGNTLNLDWRVELMALKGMGINVYPMKCLSSGCSFWQELSEAAGTPLMELDAFGDSADTLGMVAAAAGGTATMDAYMARKMSGGDEIKCSVMNTSILRGETAKYDKLRDE